MIDVSSDNQLIQDFDEAPTRREFKDNNVQRAQEIVAPWFAVQQKNIEKILDTRQFKKHEKDLSPEERIAVFDMTRKLGIEKASIKLGIKRRVIERMIRRNEQAEKVKTSAEAVEVPAAVVEETPKITREDKVEKTEEIKPVKTRKKTTAAIKTKTVRTPRKTKKDREKENEIAAEPVLSVAYKTPAVDIGDEAEALYSEIEYSAPRVENAILKAKYTHLSEEIKRLRSALDVFLVS